MFSLARRTLFAVNLCLFLSFSGLGTAVAQMQKGDYLWFDYGVQDDRGGVKESEQLFVSYGQLPDKKGNLSELEQLEVFCTFGKNDEQGAPIYHRLDVEYRDGRPSVIIKSHEDTWCGVFAKASRKDAQMSCLYTASTSFFVQGGPEETIGKEKYYDDIFVKSIDIELFRERIKNDDTIYRQMGFPLSFTVRFSGRPLSNRGVLVVDDTGKIIQLKTSWLGKFAYQPWGRRKFREDIIIIEQEGGGYLYKSTYTVFFKQNANASGIIRNLNIPFGVAIFFASFFTCFVLALIARKKFNHENS